MLYCGEFRIMLCGLRLSRFSRKPNTIYPNDTFATFAMAESADESSRKLHKAVAIWFVAGYYDLLGNESEPHI